MNQVTLLLIKSVVNRLTNGFRSIFTHQLSFSCGCHSKKHSQRKVCIAFYKLNPYYFYFFVLERIPDVKSLHQDKALYYADVLCGHKAIQFRFIFLVCLILWDKLYIIYSLYRSWWSAQRILDWSNLTFSVTSTFWVYHERYQSAYNDDHADSLL